MSKCACENIHCEICRGDGCNNPSAVATVYVGAICVDCANFMPDQYLLDKKAKRFKVVNTWPSNVFDSGTASRAEWLSQDALVKLLESLATAAYVIGVGETFLIERVDDAYEGSQT